MEVGTAPILPLRAYIVYLFEVGLLSRFLDLLKQLPKGKEEIPDDLLKRLDIAACNLVNSQDGQYDLSEEERRVYSANDLQEVQNRPGGPGLEKKFPMPLGEVVILRRRGDKDWYLGIRFGRAPYSLIRFGSKEKILNEEERLITLREEKGELAFEDEVMRLRDAFLDATDEEWDLGNKEHQVSFFDELLEVADDSADDLPEVQNRPGGLGLEKKFPMGYLSLRNWREVTDDSFNN